MTHTDPEGAALLRAILMHPAEDTPRLVYADWLQERGDEARAEFIRNTRENWFHVNNLWHEISACIPTAKIAGYGREDGTGLPRWTFNLPELWGRAFYERGFLSEICLPLSTFMQHAKDLFLSHPIERVTLTTNDRAVWFNADRDIFGWWCEDELSTLTDPNILTLPLMIHMDGDKRRCDKLIANRFNCEEMRGCILFREDSHARDALSQACVAYGRSLAGLPALEVA